MKGEKKRRGRGRRRREEEKEGDQAKVWKFCMDSLIFCMEIMDYSMILIQELLGYGLLVFHLDINLVPFSRVLLSKQSNYRFKGSLVEKP